MFLDNWPLAFDEAYCLHICLSLFVKLVIFSVWCLAFQFRLPYSALWAALVLVISETFVSYLSCLLI